MSGRPSERAFRRNGAEEIDAVSGARPGYQGESDGDDARPAAAETGNERTDRKERDRNNDEDGQFGLGGVGMVRTVGNALEMVHLGRSLGMVAVFVALIGIGGLVCGQPWWLPGFAVFCCCLVAGLFYRVFRRWGSRAGPFGDTGSAELALMAGSVVLLLVGEAEVRITGPYLALAGLLVCGASVGAGLAAVGEREQCGFWKALQGVMRLEREAKKQAWREMVEERS